MQRTGIIIFIKLYFFNKKKLNESSWSLFFKKDFSNNIQAAILVIRTGNNAKVNGVDKHII